MKDLLRIGLVGAESTGKTTLASLLAEHYKTIWVPEFARDYLQATGSPCTWDDVTAIAQGHVAREDEYALQASRVVFCDPSLLVSLVWSVYNFGSCPDLVAKMVRDRKYDLYLLTDIDIPWVDDGLRCRPEDRSWFHERFLLEFNERGLPYVLLSGNPTQRLRDAIYAVDALLGTISQSRSETDNFGS